MAKKQTDRNEQKTGKIARQTPVVTYETAKPAAKSPVSEEKVTKATRKTRTKKDTAPKAQKWVGDKPKRRKRRKQWPDSERLALLQALIDWNNYRAAPLNGKGTFIDYLRTPTEPNSTKKKYAVRSTRSDDSIYDKCDQLIREVRKASGHKLESPRPSFNEKLTALLSKNSIGTT